MNIEPTKAAHENIVSVKLEKEFFGKMYPIIEEDLFEIAFKKAKTEYGTNKEQKFWWKNQIYTIEEQ